MTRTDGEHELVLGNRQLLSAFFVVVILLGVFFTMGYFVGKNTASGFNNGSALSSGGARQDAAAKPGDSNPTPSPASDSPAPIPDAGSGPPTQSAIDPATSGQPAVTPPQAKSEERPPKPPREEPVAQAPETTASPTIAKPNGEDLYLQVFALRRPDADNEVRMLKERGYPALLGESSKPGIYRVMVGPFKTSGEMGRTKADLKAKGIESIVVK